MISCSASVPGTCGMQEQVWEHWCCFVAKMDRVQKSKAKFYADAEFDADDECNADAESVRFDNSRVFWSQASLNSAVGRSWKGKQEQDQEDCE